MASLSHFDFTELGFDFDEMSGGEGDGGGGRRGFSASASASSSASSSTSTPAPSSSVSSPLFGNGPISDRTFGGKNMEIFHEKDDKEGEKPLKRGGKFWKGGAGAGGAGAGGEGGGPKEAWGIRKNAKTVMVKMPSEEREEGGGKGRKERKVGVKKEGGGSFSFGVKKERGGVGAVSAPLRNVGTGGGKKGREALFEEKMLEDSDFSGGSSSSSSSGEGLSWLLFSFLFFSFFILFFFNFPFHFFI